MGKYFTIAELEKSTTATNMGISNIAPPACAANLNTLIDKVLDPIRFAWGKPIIVNSGFRCPALNTAVKGAASSQHMLGEAADITAGSKAENERLFNLIKQLSASHQITFDQLIDESNFSWVHISYRTGRNRKEILKL